MLGNSIWWANSDHPGNWEIDISRRPTPLTLWQLVIDGVFETCVSDYETMEPYDNTQEEDRYEFDDDIEQGIGWSDHLNSVGAHWPQAQYYYTPTFGREEDQSCGELRRDFRAGAKRDHGFPFSWSGNPQWEETACLRRKISLEAYGYHPYVGWGTLSDTADRLYEEETTGNPRLPPWKSSWGRFEEKINSWSGKWCTRRMNAEARELKLDSLIVENCVNRRKDLDMGRHRRKNSPTGDFWCGSIMEAGDPMISKPLKTGNQDELNSVADRELGTETISLLMSPRSESTQGTYLENLEMRTKFCQRRGASPWVDTSKLNWDAEILNFLDWEYPVMENGSSVLSARFALFGSCI